MKAFNMHLIPRYRVYRQAGFDKAESMWQATDDVKLMSLNSESMQDAVHYQNLMANCHR
jgi:hypothetical protein